MPDQHRATVSPGPALPRLDAQLERWLQRMRHAATRPPSAPAEDRGGLSEVRIRGSLAELPEPAGALIALTRTGGRWAHRGVMALRGPTAPLGWDSESPLDAAQRAAVEFAVTWFGAPFDAVDCVGSGLAWGLWRLTGVELADALRDFRARAPLGFSATVSRYGVEVGQDAQGGSVLRFTPPGGATLEARAAEAAICHDPRCVAVLAWASREAGAREAQLGVLLRCHVTPVAEALGGAARHPRALAAVLAVEALDRMEAHELGMFVARRAARVEPALRTGAALLARRGKGLLSARVWKALTALELDLSLLGGGAGGGRMVS